MPCTHYKDALIEAAGSGAEPQGGLRVHLAGCADCRAAFEQEQAFFASIDAGLRLAANWEVPASLLPQVRARLDEESAPRRLWIRQLVFAAASVVLATAIFQFVRPHQSGGANQAKQTPQIPASETPVKNARLQISRPGTEIASSSMNNSQTRGRSTFLHLVASSQPEVLVPPDEREAFARFVVTVGGRREVPLALATPPPQAKDEPASLEPLQINELKIKPLAGTESGESDEAEQKQ